MMAPEVTRRARDAGAIIIGLLRHQAWKRPRRRPVPGVGKRSCIGGAFVLGE